MAEEKRPQTQVYGPVERCRHCGADDPKGCVGHEFEPQPWPALPPAAEMRVRTEYTTRPEDGPHAPGHVLAYAEHLPTGQTAHVRRWRTPGEHAIRSLPDAAELAMVADFARLLVARLLCPHTDQAVWAGVARILERDATEQEPMPPVAGFHLDVRCWCVDCGEPFVFVGDQLRLGLSPAHPTVDVEGTTLAAPLRPIQYPETWGRNRPGFGVKVW